MAADLFFRYDLLVQNAYLGVVRSVLSQVAATGELPGEHHFVIAFRTDARGVKISPRLQREWPQEITIILQHQFSNLVVGEEGFSVTLFFRSVPETLHVPFTALRAFADPAAGFSFQFNVEGEENEELDSAPRPAGSSPAKPEQPSPPSPSPRDTPAKDAPPSAPSKGDKIVSIDAFRKKS
ncbi:SspB family protein [Methylocystis bryophila]|uniref:Stringent starvation protein B n=1 Tax=Methylocystis bryophila TaxID=655015 RepID=A0A1W6MZE4_9HYPH|nr:ClpXP protease specificity-enhancing factor SspB [Methylocystis bryophila]ARN82967.1 hypothetical protein B1812_19900 [Methylocystis bryophila]BDV39256.1 hypothetical protein DSM21852_25090 [Methylocystis bryophila]